MIEFNSADIHTHHCTAKEFEAFRELGFGEVNYSYQVMALKRINEMSQLKTVSLPMEAEIHTDVED